MRHTKLPWKRDADPFLIRTATGRIDNIVASTDRGVGPEEQCEADADFIVTACNAHDQLVDVCQRLLADHQRIYPHHADLCGLCKDAKAALKAAGIE